MFEYIQGNVWGHHLALNWLDDWVCSLYCERNHPTLPRQLPSYGQSTGSKILANKHNISSLTESVYLSLISLNFASENVYYFKEIISKQFSSIKLFLVYNVEITPWRLDYFILFYVHNPRIASSTCPNNGWHLL